LVPVVSLIFYKQMWLWGDSQLTFLLQNQKPHFLIILLVLLGSPVQRPVCQDSPANFIVSSFQTKNAKTTVLAIKNLRLTSQSNAWRWSRASKYQAFQPDLSAPDEIPTWKKSNELSARTILRNRTCMPLFRTSLFHTEISDCQNFASVGCCPHPR